MLLNEIIRVAGEDFEKSDIPAYLSPEAKEKIWSEMSQLREIEKHEKILKGASEVNKKLSGIFFQS